MLAAKPLAPPATMTAAEAAVRVMESEGVDLAFGIPGASILPLYNALRRSTIRSSSLIGTARPALPWRRIANSSRSASRP